MFFRILICLILLIIGHKLAAQKQPTEEEKPTDPFAISATSTRTAVHYVGLQANQLLRQLISFGNAAAVNNPYALTYAVNSRANGFGFAMGVGYNISETKTTDQFISVVSKINDFGLRFGLEKKTYFSKNWMFSLGGDIVIESNKAETKSTQSGGGGAPGSTMTVTTTEKRNGFGPRLTLNYQIHSRILLGTEAAYYYKGITQEQTTTGQTGIPATPKTNLRSFSLAAPTVLFLIMKF